MPGAFEISSVTFNLAYAFNPSNLNMPSSSSGMLALFRVSSFEAVIVDLNTSVVF